MWSMAEMLRIASAAELDVDPRELEVGLQPYPTDHGPSRRIFVADRLENGAGYANRLGEPDALARVLDRVVDELGERYSAGRHGQECDSSCPDCLRSYDNRVLHPVLDWRLGLDLAELAAQRPLRMERWLGDGERIATGLAEAFGLEPGTIAGLPTLSDDGRPKTAVLCHPMWSAAERSRRLDGAVATTTGCPTSAASTSTPPSRSPTRSRSGCMRSEAPIGACGLPNAQKSCIKTRSMTSLPRRSR